jgi:hypothetical protein
VEMGKVVWQNKWIILPPIVGIGFIVLSLFL